jgi:DNA gyrase/topoisomerase IV subunit B
MEMLETEPSLCFTDNDFDELFDALPEPCTVSASEDPLDALLSWAETMVVEPLATQVSPVGPARGRGTPAPKGATRPPLTRAAAKEPAATGPDAGDASAAGRVTISSIKDHAKKKGMWAGALKPVTIPDLLGAVPAKPDTDADTDTDTDTDTEGDEPEGGKTPARRPARGRAQRPKVTLIDIERAHTPALLKIIDEIVVNATDHAKGQEKAPLRQRVTRIDITFDRATGEISVHNDGPGIPVVLNAEASAAAGRQVYDVEVNFAWFLAGTNIDKELDNVKGGINGLGAKLANVHSVVFTVRSVDGGTHRHYTQRFRNRLDDTDPPVIIDLRRKHDLPASETAPHTRVTFVPAYRELGYRVQPQAEGHDRLGKADADDLEAWLRLRAHQAAAYAGAKVAVTFNGERCETTDAAALGRLLLTLCGAQEEAGQAIVLSAQAKATEEPYKQHPWNIAVVVLPPGKKAGRRAAAQNMTIVNGVLSNKGSHVQYLKKMLSEAVEDKLRKATKRTRAAPKTGAAAAKVLKAAAAAKGAAKSAPKTPKDPDDKKMSVTETLGGVQLVMCGAIPGADWGGQRKDELQVEPETLRKYTLTAAFLKTVGDAVAERILIAQGLKGGKVVHDKYTKARHAGKAAHKRQTYLMAAEGDSAITLLRAGLTQTRKAVPPGGPSLDWCGIISLQGVIVNAAREVTEMETSGGEVINIRSAKLQNNKRLLTLADAFGLRYDRTYTTAEELATLNYGQLLLCVDQDLDGTGKIAALVLVWIYLFWPALIKAGRVGRFMTPLIRVYPKKGTVPVEFYYEEELTRWLEANPTWRDTHQKPKYYKGLAGHDEDEVKRMFTPEAFKRSIYTYTMDDTAKRLFEVYFGADPALRKEALVSPVAHLSYEETLELHRRRQIPVGRVQLDVDTKSYKNDAIKRQISGGPDGLNPARRKILLGAIRRFGGEAAAKELKIFQLGGYVADKCFYHHGDASLNGTIVYLAQAYAGARKYPYLTGVGQFGSRHGDKAGSARYISVKLSPLVKATLPPADRWHLKYVLEDGEQAEPAYFVPVVPMAALESYRIVSEGWNHDSHGRDLDATLGVVDAYIAGEPGLTAAADRLRAEGPTPEVMALLERLAKLWHLPASTRGFDGEVRYYRGESWSFGAYAWEETTRTVTVTELPMGLTTAKYLETLLKPGRGGKPNPRAEFIEAISDRSSADKVELEVVLREGAFEKIGESFGDASIDPVEDALMLRTSLRPHLNYYSAEGAVLEFGECYLAAILYWAPLRRDLYVERLTREQTVAELRIVEEEQIIRYTAMAAELDLAEVEDDDVAAGILRDRDFPPLDKSLLHRPEYTPNAQLRELVTAGPGANHDYILDLKERELVRTAVVRRQKVLEGLRGDLVRVAAQLSERPVAGASVWRAEIEEFRKVVARGIVTNWKFK